MIKKEQTRVRRTEKLEEERRYEREEYRRIREMLLGICRVRLSSLTAFRPKEIAIYIKSPQPHT